MYVQQLGRPIPPSARSMADDATNGGSQKAVWESDAAIVPKTPGNAGAGKGGTQLGPV